MMEKSVCSKKSRTVSPDKTLICGTRYGNGKASSGISDPVVCGSNKEGSPYRYKSRNDKVFNEPEEAVELVVFAFQHAGRAILWFKNQHRPLRFSKAIKELFNADNDIQIIGTRHGEKLYETLLTKEEFLVARIWYFYRVSADKRISITTSILWKELSLSSGNIIPITPDD